MLHQSRIRAARPGALRAVWFAILQALLLPAVSSQFADDFSDAVFAPWQGDTTHFAISPAGELQLNAPSGTTTAWLHVPVGYADSMAWEFKVRLDFAPSASNQLRIFLGLTTNDLSTASGYVLEIGATGDQDALVFYQFNQGTFTQLGASAPGIVATEPVDLDLRITAHPNGSWVIEHLDAGLPHVLLTAQDTGIALSQLRHFGLLCRYTETRRDKFRFDDFRIGPWQPDTIPPVWLGLDIISDREVMLSFDEPLDPAIASSTNHYLLNPSGKSPDIAEADGASITLAWPESFISGQPYSLAVEGLADMAGNRMAPATLPFVWTRIDTAVVHQLLITEIMADPSPSIGLPDAEYLELYNSGPGIYKLSDYTLTIGSSQRMLPDSLIRPGEFVIVCDQLDVGRFAPYGKTVPVSSLPALPNNGAELKISTLTGNVIHAVDYAHGWYGDSAKDDGGWSLEMRNPMAVCAGHGNWSASNNLQGGTPGSPNSNWTPILDMEGPLLVSLHMIGPLDLRIMFDENVDQDLMTDVTRYAIEPPIPISQISLIENNLVNIRLVAPPDTGLLYWLTAYPAFDCLGNPGEAGVRQPFGLPAIPQPGYLLLNEVLFNPAVGGSRFIELLNTTSRYLDLSGLIAGRITTSATQLFPIGIPASLAPGGLVVFTTDTADVRKRYSVPRPDMLFPASLPAWDEDADNVAILANGLVLDSLTYSSDWHHPLLRDVNGVSLERISPNAPTSAPDTWHSAAGASGYGTPTGENSQRLSIPPVSDKPYSLLHPVFSPNDDGDKDYLSIRFDHGDQDLACSVMIHDLEGRDVALAADNVLLGRHSLVQWNGRRSDGSMADMGFYVIFIRLWSPGGMVSEYTETCALVQR